MQPPDIRVVIDLRGTTVTIRPITPADKEIEAAFVRNLSEQSRYDRFHGTLKALTPAQLERFTNVAYPDNMALIATLHEDGKEKQIAVARYAKFPDRDAAEVAIVVADEWQDLGLGRRLLIELRTVAVAAGIHELQMNVLTENRRMMKLAQDLGFRTVPTVDDYTARQLGKTISSKPSTPDSGNA